MFTYICAMYTALYRHKQNYTNLVMVNTAHWFRVSARHNYHFSAVNFVVTRQIKGLSVWKNLMNICIQVSIFPLLLEAFVQTTIITAPDNTELQSMSWSLHMLVTVAITVSASFNDGGFFLTCKDSEGRFNDSFPSCPLFLFFEVEINLRTPILLFRPGSVYSRSARFPHYA